MATVETVNVMIDRQTLKSTNQKAISLLGRASLEGRVELAPKLDSSPVLSTIV